MTDRIDPEDRAFVAKVERETGLDVKRVEHVSLLPLVNGKCGDCGVPIRYLNVMLCEACIDKRYGHS